jgi:hypothetical protein
VRTSVDERVVIEARQQHRAIGREVGQIDGQVGGKDGPSDAPLGARQGHDRDVATAALARDLRAAAFPVRLAKRLEDAAHRAPRLRRDPPRGLRMSGM